MSITVTFITFLFTLVTMGTAFSQHSLTKDEILAMWKNVPQETSMDSVFRSQIHAQTRLTLDNLLTSGVDTLVVYSVSYPGSIELGKDSCSTLYPVDSYFFWKHQGASYFKNVNGKCESKQMAVNGKVIKFTSDNYTKLTEEFFMTVVYGVKTDGDKFVVSGNQTAHEPKYSILVQLNNGFEFFKFNDSELRDKKSLFYDYNHDLTAYKLFRLIESQIE